jgi:NTP pyrophosphatase (non-canonical NTP hydrolase)
MTLKEIVKQSWQTADDKGWHEDATKKPAEDIALMHSELSEALEELRRHHPAFVYFTLDDQGVDKPEGCPVELADVLIRIGDFCEVHGVDLERAVSLKQTYNKTRKHRYGGKKF